MSLITTIKLHYNLIICQILNKFVIFKNEKNVCGFNYLILWNDKRQRCENCEVDVEAEIIDGGENIFRGGER